MPAAIENSIRAEIIERHQGKESLRSISRELNLSYETVKNIWQHWVKKGQLEPSYEWAKRHGTRTYGAVYALALALKQAHPGWGAPLILLELERQDSGHKLPSVRTLQRWYREAGLSRGTMTKVKREKTVKRGAAVHQVWAVDAKERMVLADGSDASWLVVSDEASGAILYTEVFPPQVLDSGDGSGGSAELADSL